VGRVTPCAPPLVNPRLRRAEDCPPYQFCPIVCHVHNPIDLHPLRFQGFFADVLRRWCDSDVIKGGCVENRVGPRSNSEADPGIGGHGNRLRSANRCPARAVARLVSRQTAATADELQPAWRAKAGGSLKSAAAAAGDRPALERNAIRG